jgi:GNAT superfamily N-acetyltransferase
MAGSDGAPPLLRLVPADAEDVLPLSIEAGWNQVAADWRLMLAAGRAFGIREEGEWIGSALALPLGHAVWWISMVLVARRRRRQGHGTRLLTRCIAEAAASGAAIGLDATAFGRPLYLSLGFRDCHEVSRWQCATIAERVDPPPGIRVRPATGADLARIARYDAARSGFQRAAVLADLCARAPALAHVAHDGNGEIAGFVLGRDGHRATHIGPIIAEEEAIGLALLGSAAARCLGGFIIDVPQAHAGVAGKLAAAGASPSRRYMRMLRGTAPWAAAHRHLFAIAGPELA